MCVIFRLGSVYRAPRALLRSNPSRLLCTWALPMSESSTSSERKKKWSRTSSISNCHIQVIGTGAGELKPSLFLFTDSKRYLFNCVENIQRFSNEHKIRQAKLSNFFITRMSWDNVGGFSGQLLHFVNFFEPHKMQSLRLHGPEALSDFIYTSRFHIHTRKMQLDANDPLEDYHGHTIPVYRDENLTVRTLNISLSPPPSPPSSSSSSDESGDNEDLAGKAPPAKRHKLTRNNPSSISVFICKLADVPGKFNPKKAAELGLRPGPSYRALVNGESVRASDGRVVRPNDVLGPVRIGPTFIVLECPHPRFIEPVTSHPLLQKEILDNSGQNLALIAHMSPRGVVESEEYSKWMASLGSETKHLLLHKTVCPPDWTLRKLLKSHGQMHFLDPTVFRKYSELSKEDNFPDKLLNFIPRDNVIIGKSLMQYHLKPLEKAGVDESQQLDPFSSYWESLVTNFKSNRDFRRAVEKLPKGDTSREEISPTPTSSSSLSQPVEDRVTFLGTGASSPSSFRNVSSVLLQTERAGNVVFDCGEGTLSQLYRHFGAKEGDAVLADLAAVFLSHIHGDHNLGAVSLLRRRAEMIQRRAQSSGEVLVPTTVVGPGKIGRWLRDYNRTCEKLFFDFVDSAQISEEGAISIGSEEESMKLLTVPVIHCPEAYGAVVTQGEDWKVVYSGDTRPCRALVEAGKNAKLLIHEATLEDGCMEEAKHKLHCTVSEALQVAEEMNSDFTILTHFSQRYSRFLPIVLGRKRNMRLKVFPAFDHVSVALSDVHKLPALLPAVQHIMANILQEDDGDDDTSKLSWGW